MKLHLILVFFLAMPLVGRLLSNDSATSVEACDSSAPASADPQLSTPPPTDNRTTVSPASEPAPATATTTSTKSADRRTNRARAVNFM